MTSLRLPTRFRRNVATNYANSGVSAIVALLLTPVLAHGLGKEQFGIWVLATSLSLYVDILDIGVGSATIKYVAEYNALGEMDRVRRAISTAFTILVPPGMFALAGGVVLAHYYPSIFDIGPELAGTTTALVLIVAIPLAISIPSDTFGGTLGALQRFDLANLSLISALVASALASWLIIELGGGLIALGITNAVIGLAGQATRFFMVRRLVPGATVSIRLFDRSLVRPLASLSAWLAIGRSAQVAINRIDTLIVGVLLGASSAGVYAIGQKLAFAAQKLVIPGTLGFFPFASELAARSDREGLRQALLTGTRISLAIAAPVTIILIVLAEPLIDAWVGPSFADASRVVVYLVAANAIDAFSRTSYLIMQGGANARTPALIIGVEAIVNVGLSIGLGLRMGLEGVALATLIASSFARLGLLVPAACRTFGVRILSLLNLVARAHVAPAAATLGAGWMIRQTDLPSVVIVLVGGAVMFAVYLGIFALTGLESDERARAWAAIRGLRPATPRAVER
jgi:O-antigen/teichoic acid export membrane protein